MDFRDEVMAAATLFVVNLFLYLIPPIFEIYNTLTVGWVLAVLISALIVGFIFAGKLVVTRIKSIADVVVLIIVAGAFFNAIICVADIYSLVYGAVVRGMLSFIGLYAGSMLKKPKKT